MIPVSWEMSWLHPPLLRALAASLEDFPLKALEKALQGSDEPSQEVAIIRAGVHRRGPRWRALAAELDRRNATSILLELARLVRASVGVGARMERGLSVEIANLIVANCEEEERLLVQHQLIAWAERTRVGHLSAEELLDALLVDCPLLEPARAILLDFLDRLDRLLYIPFLFELPLGTIGVCVPVKIEADFEKEVAEPLFGVLGQAGGHPLWLHVEQGFRTAIKKGRAESCRFLAARQSKPAYSEFAVKVTLPDVRLVPTWDLVYEQGSVALPTTIALFCKQARIRDLVTMNPEVVPSGPVTLTSIQPKVEAVERVGAVRLLLVTPKLNDDELPRMVHDRWESDADGILREYLQKRDWEDLNWKKSKVLSFGVSYEREWSRPLDVGRTNSLSKLLPNVQRHRKALTNLLAEQQAIQLKALAGLGKTWLVAQWLHKVQDQYDRVLYTSIPVKSVAAAAKWMDGALTDLAGQLSRRAGISGLQNRLRRDPGLLARPADLIEALQESIAGKVLWVIDNGQAVVDDDFRIREERFRALISAVRNGHWSSAHVLFVTTSQVVSPNLPLYPAVGGAPVGFTVDEAQQYLDNGGWPFHALKDKVVKLLGAHPRALSLMLQHAVTPGVPQAEIRQLLNDLPADWETQVRDVVCRSILEQMLIRLTGEERWTLKLASTFLEGFTRFQFNRLLDIKRIDVTNIVSFEDSLGVLDHRSLLSVVDQKYWMHDLVRNYIQDQFKAESPKAFRHAHQVVGEIYFPLKKGRRISRPDTTTRAKYANAVGCGVALYHFEAANSDQAQREVLGNTYENEIAQAKWQMQFGRPGRGFRKSEELLRRVLEVCADRTRENIYAGAEEVSWDINVLMARSLLGTHQPQKYSEAAFHYRQAVEKGRIECLPLLTSALCDLALVPKTGSTASPEWRDAWECFQRLRATVRHESGQSQNRIGEAYEKVIQCLVSLEKLEPGDSLIWELINEAVVYGLRWDGVYEIAYDLSIQMGRTDEARNWLERGLIMVPQSPRLWSKFYLLEAKAGRHLAIDEKLRYSHRRITTIVELFNLLVSNDCREAAVDSIMDALRLRQGHPELTKMACKVLTEMGCLPEAERLYREAIRRVPDGPDCYLGLGALLETRQKWEAAEQVYRQGIKNQPNEQSCYVALGALLETRHKLEAAEQVYRQGIHRQPNAHQCYCAVGALQVKLGQWDAAEQSYKSALKIQPTLSSIRVALGAIIARERESEAERLYLDGVELGPHSSLYLALGRLYERQGHLESAEHAYRDAFELLLTHPSISTVRNFGQYPLALGGVLERKGRLAEAVAVYRKALVLDPALVVVQERLRELSAAADNT
jgi:tetratricopeptide (TPR) repeat protein